MERASPFLWNENILNTHYYGQRLTKINQNCGFTRHHVYQIC